MKEVPQFRDVWLPETSFKCITNKPSPFPSTLHSFQASPVPDSRYLAVIVIVVLCYVDSICVFFPPFLRLSLTRQVPAFTRLLKTSRTALLTPFGSFFWKRERNTKAPRRKQNWGCQITNLFENNVLPIFYEFVIFPVFSLPFGG